MRPTASTEAHPFGYVEPPIKWQDFRKFIDDGKPKWQQYAIKSNNSRIWKLEFRENDKKEEFKVSYVHAQDGDKAIYYLGEDMEEATRVYNESK